MSKVIVPLDNGYSITVERNTGEYDKEMYIGIEDEDGRYIQDLVLVRPTYKFVNEHIHFDTDKFEILVFGDATQDDYTDKFTVPLVQDDE